MADEIFVFSENPVLLVEMLGKARQEADRLGWKVSTWSWGADSLDLAAAGADVIYQVEAARYEDPETVTAVLSGVVQQVQPALVLVGGSKLGMEVAPRVAERTSAGYAAWAVDFDINSNTCAVTAHCMLYAGIGKATYQFRPAPVILSVAPGVFAAEEAAGRSAVVTPLSISVEAPKINLVEVKPKVSRGSRLEEAKLVVDIGQGVKQREDLALVETLASQLDGQVACSRPISSDRDWYPEWLGLSGKKIKPELCMALGVSGAIQHLVGIRDSHLIVSVNTDEGAPIFKQSDYGVVADLYEFVPAFTERLKARGVRPTWKA